MSLLVSLWRYIWSLRRSRSTALTVAAVLLVWWLAEMRARRKRRRVKQHWKAALEGGKLVADMKKRGFEPGSFIKLSQGKTHFRLEGPEDGVPVVIFHGFGVFSFVYQRMTPLLVQRGYRVLTFDFLGFGYSTAAPGTTFNANLFVEQAAELVNAVGMTTPFVLVAHSMGGLMASVFTTRYPELVQRLVLIAPAGLPVTKSANFYMSLIHSGKDLVTLPFVGRYLTKVLIRLLKAQVNAVVRVAKNKRNLSYNSLCDTSRYLSRVTSQSELRNTPGRFVAMLDMTGKGLAFQQGRNPDFARTITEVLGNCDLFGDWSTTYRKLASLQSRIPTTVLWGDKDEFVPIDACHDTLQPILTEASYVFFEDCDHFLFLNRQEDFLRELFAVCDPLRPKKASPRARGGSGAGADFEFVEEVKAPSQ